MKPLSGRKKIGIFRALQLGDMLCSVPALRALRNYYPESDITLISLPWAEEFAHRFSHYIDHFIVFPGFPGLPEQQFDAKKILEFVVKVQKERFDLLLQMHGDGSILNPFLQLFNAKQLAGFYKEGSYCPDPTSFLPYPITMSEIEKNLSLLEFLNIPSQGMELEFPLCKQEQLTLYSHPLFKSIKTRPYVCIHPGARDPKRRWSPQYFASVANALSDKGFAIVFTGTNDELPIIHELMTYLKHKAVIFAGQLSLGATAQLLQHATLLISNCTGIVHVADALRVPSVTLYLHSDIRQWAPLNTKLHKQVFGKDICTPTEVLQKVRKLLGSNSQVVSPMRGVFV